MGIEGQKAVCQTGRSPRLLYLILLLYACSLPSFFSFAGPAVSGSAFAAETAPLGAQLKPLMGTAQWRWLGRFTGRRDGVLVSGVEKDSPAEQMGIKPNDVILSFNYKDVKSPEELTNAVSALNPGAKVVFTVFRMSPTLLTIEGTIGGSRQVAETGQPPKPTTDAKPVDADISARIFAPTGQHEILSVAFSPDGRQVVSGGNVKNSLKLWDIATGRDLKTFAGDSDAVYAVAFSPDGRYVLSGSANHTMKLWDVAALKEIRAFTASIKDDLIDAVAFSPDGRYALSGASDRMLRLWDIASGGEVRAFGGHAGWVSAVVFSPDGRYALSGSWDATLKLWDVAGGKEVRSFPPAAATPAGRAGRRGAPVSQAAPDKYTPADVVPAPVQLAGDKLGMKMASFAGRISSVAFSPDGRYALSGNWGGILTIWDIATGREVGTFKGHTDRVNAVAFTSDGKSILSSARDNTIRLWDAASGRETKVFSGHRGDINSLAVSGNAAGFISGGSDGTVRRWDIGTGREIAQFISLKDGEWIVIAPEGYYNSSLNGHKYLSVRLGDAVYGIDQFYDVFYRPDIVAAKLKGDDISGLITLTIDDALRNPP
ncbi:MAG: PDZ domain-containing protein, partial [Thermodesulfobacteriota bacterium]